MAVHLAITRRVRPGCQAEFKAMLREFIRVSLAADGVCGAHMLLPADEDAEREFGIFRTFASASDRDAFYASPLFRDWERQVAPLTEGSTTMRELHGFELWFRGGVQPPRWKMAVLVFLAVFIVTGCLSNLLGPVLSTWPFLVRNAAFNLVVVILLTWAVMPVLTRLAAPWLHAGE